MDKRITDDRFASDNCAGLHQQVLAELTLANNEGFALSYGDDAVTAGARVRFQQELGENAYVTFVPTGGGANVLGLGCLLTERYHAVVCARRAHVNRHECGAIERMLGHKLIQVETGPDGKLTPELIAPYLTARGDVHEVQCRVLSITNATEVGTVYRSSELKRLISFANAQGMLVHLDGARLSNAVAAGRVDLFTLTTLAGIDAFTFGGAKNGAMCDAVVCYGKELQDRIPFLQKQTCQLVAPMRFYAAQWDALMMGRLWWDNANHANNMALALSRMLEVFGLELTRSVETNAVFVKLPASVAAHMLREYTFYPWEEPNEYRLMCSWRTTIEDIQVLEGVVERALKA